MGCEGRLSCLDAVSGAAIFSKELDGMAVAAPVVGQNRIWCVLFSGEVVCLDSSVGRIKWRRKLQAPVSAAPALGWQLVVAADRSGALKRLRAGRQSAGPGEYAGSPGRIARAVAGPGGGLRP